MCAWGPCLRSLFEINATWGVQVACELIAALGGIKVMLPIVSGQDGHDDSTDCKGPHIEAVIAALDVLASNSDNK